MHAHMYNILKPTD